LRAGIGGFLKVAGLVAWAIFGIWGFLLCLAIVSQAAGFWGVVVCFFVFPVTFVAVPWYAGVAWGNWFPLLICYGGEIVASILFAVGSTVAGDET
jgi:hypothetical protein